MWSPRYVALSHSHLLLKSQLTGKTGTGAEGVEQVHLLDIDLLTGTNVHILLFSTGFRFRVRVEGWVVMRGAKGWFWSLPQKNEPHKSLRMTSRFHCAFAALDGEESIVGIEGGQSSEGPHPMPVWRSP